MTLANELFQRLWNSADILRSNMDASEYKSYLLGLIFYKYLSDIQLEEVAELLELDKDMTLDQIDDEYKKYYYSEDGEDLTEELTYKFSYVIKPDLTYTHFLKEIDSKEFELDHLAQGFSEIEQASPSFQNLFEDVDLYSKRLGSSLQKQNDTISKVMKELSGLNLSKYTGDVLGDVYEYMIGEFATESGKKAGEFYTPQEVSSLMARIAMTGKEELKGFTVFDPTMGSGSLLLNPRKYSKERDSIHYYGQEKNNSTYNLARMNMILHSVPMASQSLSYGDSLAEDWPVDEPTAFDAVLMNPPYSAKRSYSKGFLDDPRFAGYGVLPPKSKADMAFLLHGFYHLKHDGVMVIVLPHGPLFRGGAEGKIRQKLLENGSIDGVIGLPQNVFYNTSIPTILMILKKNKTHRSVFFIDAKDEYEKSGTRNTLTEENIEKIYKTYIERKDVDKFAHLASFEEIEENDFNLNIPRYVDTFEEEEDIPLSDVAKELMDNKKDMEKTKADIIGDLKGLVGTNEENQKDLEAFLKLLGANND